MKRSDILSIPVVLLGALILAIVGLIIWCILAIPALAFASKVPDPRAMIMPMITRRALKSMMSQGGGNGRKAA